MKWEVYFGEVISVAAAKVSGDAFLWWLVVDKLVVSEIKEGGIVKLCFFLFHVEIYYRFPKIIFRKRLSKQIFQKLFGGVGCLFERTFRKSRNSWKGFFEVKKYILKNAF